MILSTLAKSLQVIETLSHHPQGLSLSQLAAQLRFPKSTIHHMLRTFLEYDYVSQDPETRKYQLGFRFLSISSRILDNLDVRRTAYPHLRRLHQACGETVHLSILRNGKVTYIDKIQKSGGLSLATYIGFSTDPHAAAGGKVLLAGLADQDVLAMYRNRPLKRYGKKTLTDRTRLLEELQKVRSQGYAIDDEEYYQGVRCVAAPVRAGGRIVAAVSITGSVFSMTMERIEQNLVGLVMKCAEEISAKLQW